MRFRSIVPAVVILASALSGQAGGEETGFAPYLGQETPGETATVFAPGLVSLPGRFEYALSISPDGKEILFSTEIPGESSRILGARIADGRWSLPRPLSLTRGARKAEMEAFFSPDGRELFFAAYDEGMDVRIWVAERAADGWAAARLLESPINAGAVFYPTFAPDGTLYYSDIEKRETRRAPRVDGRFPRTEALTLGGLHAFVAPGGAYLLSDAGGDIQVSFATKEGWSTPRLLGPEVNTEHPETCPSVSPDGRYLFFSRYLPPDEIADIYWIDSRVVEKARGPVER